MNTIPLFLSNRCPDKRRHSPRYLRLSVDGGHVVASVLCDSIRNLLTCTKYFIHLDTGSHPPPPPLSHLFTTGYRWTHSVWTKALSATESCTTQALYRRLWTKPREDVIFSYSLFGHRSYSTSLHCPVAGLAEVV